jgi:hypothetical protein
LTWEAKTGKVNLFCPVTTPFFKISLLPEQVCNEALDVAPGDRFFISTFRVFREKTLYLFLCCPTGILADEPAFPADRSFLVFMVEGPLPVGFIGKGGSLGMTYLGDQ